VQPNLDLRCLGFVCEFGGEGIGGVWKKMEGARGKINDIERGRRFGVSFSS